MASLQPLDAAAQLTTAIARMLGKAVKFRHCPATVSAPASFPVVERLGRRRFLSQGHPPIADLLFQPLELNRRGSALGRRLDRASQETGPWA